MDEQRDTLRWCSSGCYLISALDSKSTAVCTGELIELLFEDWKIHVTMWTDCVRIGECVGETVGSVETNKSNI